MMMCSAPNTGWRSRNLWIGALCLLVLPFSGWAQDRAAGLSVQLITPALVESAPGRIVTLSLRVRQQTGGDAVVLETLTLPQGWRPVTPPGAFPLADGESVVRLFALLVPSATPAGRYEVRYRARSQRDPAIQDTVALTVSVAQITRLTLTVEEKPDTVVAGRSYQARLRLANQGNARVQVVLDTAGQRTGYPVRVEPAQAELPPGENLLVTVSGGTDAAARRAATHYVTVTARVAGSSEPPVAATFGVEVLPLATAVTSLYTQLPTTLTLRATGEGDRNDLQVIWQGSGDLNEKGTGRLDFLLQGPDRQETGLYGWRDAYHLNLTGPAGGLRLGDQSYGLSPLTDYFHYGRGAEMRLTPGGRYDVQAYYLQDRWSTPAARVTGVSLGQTFDDAVLRVNHAQRTLDGRVDRLWSLDGGWDCLPGTHGRTHDGRLNAEVARSQSDAGDDAFAYRAEFTGRLGRDGSFALRKIHADPDYLGYYRDCDYTTGAAAFRVGGPFRAEVGYSRYARNLARDLLRTDATREELYKATLRWNLPAGWFAALGYDDYRRRDVLAAAPAGVRERPLRLLVGRSTARSSWNTEFRVGRVDDRSGAHRQVRDVRAYAAWYPSAKQFVTLYGGYSDDQRNSELLGPDTHLGASVSWQAAENLSLSAWFTAHRLNDPSQRNEQGELSARLRLSGEQSVELRAITLSPADGARNVSYLLSYTMPLSLPAARRKSVGLITGRLYDARTPGRPGVADAVLRLEGAAAVTDRQGAFTFPALPPGDYTLTVDPHTIGLHRIPDRPLPLKVTITGGETTRVEIGVVPAAQVAGTVLLHPAERTVADAAVVGDPAARTAGEPRGLANLLVEISNGTETYRRLSDNRGAFSFERLQPGRWHVKIYPDNLPAYTRLETTEHNLDLRDDDTARLTIDVLPVTRRIKMLDNPGDDVLTLEPVASTR